MATYTPDEITPDEIAKVLGAADKDRNGRLWYLALSGLRRGEIAGLRWADIDLDTGTLSIARNSVQVGAATVVEYEPKTQSSRRTLPVDTGLVIRPQTGLGAPGAGEAGARRRLCRQRLCGVQ
jgi:integrase